MATVTTRLGEKTLGRIDELARERQVDRDSLVHLLVLRGLEQVKKERVIKTYKQRKVLLEKAARVLGIDLLELVDVLRQEGLHELPILAETPTAVFTGLGPTTPFDRQSEI